MGGKTSAAARNRYNAKAYDRITVMGKKGEKEAIKAAAERAGLSSNAYILAAVREKMEKEKEEA